MVRIVFHKQSTMDYHFQGVERLTWGDSCVEHEVDEPSAAVVVMWRKKDADGSAGTTHHLKRARPRYTMNVLSSATLLTG